MLKFVPVNDKLAVAEYGGIAITRAYGESGYSFSYTTPEALSAVREYALKEEIPLVFFGVPKEELGGLLSNFLYADVTAEDKERTSYTVRVKSELDFLSEIPSAECLGVTLGEIEEADAAEYARLSRETVLSGLWGYDYREDTPDPEDSYFLSEARLDFERGAALSLAVRTEGSFIGEAVLYRFDLEGGAEIALRLLPEWRSRGLGSRALEALLSVAEDIGLSRLTAEVMLENAPSLALFSSFMDEVRRDSERVYFELIAEEDE